MFRVSGTLTCHSRVAGEPPGVAGRTTCRTSGPPKLARTRRLTVPPPVHSVKARFAALDQGIQSLMSQSRMPIRGSTRRTLLRFGRKHSANPCLGARSRTARKRAPNCGETLPAVLGRGAFRGSTRPSTAGNVFTSLEAFLSAVVHRATPLGTGSRNVHRPPSPRDCLPVPRRGSMPACSRSK